MAEQRCQLTVNEQKQIVEAEPHTPLLYVLQNELASRVRALAAAAIANAFFDATGRRTERVLATLGRR